jgi:Zn-dependent protease with chaperone function
VRPKSNSVNGSLTPINFFERQHRARRNSRVLLALFAIAVGGTVASVDLLASLSWLLAQAWSGQRLAGPPTLVGKLLHVPWRVHLLAGGGTLAVVLGVSFAKSMILRAGGGAAVAKMLGGRWVGRANADALERRLLNVVDEMAIAAATRVPQVFVLDSQKGINAFAAGHDVSHTAIVVTRGALETLTRDELQAVVAHEFSHIVNGDMALNIRMVGLLAGIVWIGGAGEFLMRAAGRARDVRATPVLLFGLMLWLVGSVGLFFSRVIKAMLSREREYLADAGGVQFTRNPEALAGALDQIRANYSWVAHRHAEDVSHLFIADAHGFLTEPLFATHPSLEHRIERIAPDFTADPYRARRMTALSAALAAEAAPPARAMESSAPWTFTPLEAAALVGTVEQVHLEAARASLRALPQELRAALDDATRASGVVVALLLSRDDASAALGIASLGAAGLGAIADRAKASITLVRGVPPERHLGLVDLALPALRAGPAALREETVRALETVLASDRRVSVYGFAYVSFVRSQLQGPAALPMTRYKPLALLRDDAAVLLSLTAHAGCAEAGTLDRDFIAAFEAGAAEAGLVGQVSATRREACTPEAASRALRSLQDLAPLDKARLVKGLFAAITADGRIRPVELAIMRMIGGVLDCPLPPLVLPAAESASSSPAAAAIAS